MKNIYIFLIAGLFMLSFASALDEFKINEDGTITKTVYSCNNILGRSVCVQEKSFTTAYEKPIIETTVEEKIIVTENKTTTLETLYNNLLANYNKLQSDYEILINDFGKVKTELCTIKFFGWCIK
jgi:hypothetical protein